MFREGVFRQLLDVFGF